MPMDRGKMFVLGVYTAQRVSNYNNANYPQTKDLWAAHQ